MRTVTTFFLAGAMAVSVMSAALNDNLAEERYRAKYGRYTPPEEAGRAAAEQAKRDHLECCGSNDCCHHAPAEATAETIGAGPAISKDASERMRVKFGRSLDENSNSRPARVIASQNPRIPEMPHRGDFEARMQAKTGRTGRVATAPSDSERPDLLAQRVHGHACCTRH